MMRSRRLWMVLGLLGAAGCGGKDAGPFGDLLARLPADADLVVAADLAESVRTARAWADELQLLPLLQASQELKDLVQGQRTALDQVIAPLRDRLGLDPFKDLGLAVVGLRMGEGAEPRGVVVVKGAFPPDFLGRAFPDAPVESREGVPVVRLEGDGEAMLAEGVLVLAHKDLAAAAFGKPDPKRLEALLARHPALRGKLEPGFLLRGSFLVPAWVKQQLVQDRPPAGVGMGLVTGLARLDLELDRQVRLAVVAADERSAESYQHLFIAIADGVTGSQHAARAVAYMALCLDLDRLPDLPPPVRLLLKDDAALATSLEVLLPPPAAAPEVRREALGVSLRAERKSFVAIGLVGAGMVGAFLVPAMIIGMAMDDADRALEEAAPPAAPAGEGGAP